MSKQSLEEAVKLRDTSAYNLKVSVSSTLTVQVLVILKYFTWSVHLLSLAVVPAAVHHDERDEQCADTAPYPRWQRSVWPLYLGFLTPIQPDRIQGFW